MEEPVLYSKCRTNCQCVWRRESSRWVEKGILAGWLAGLHLSLVVNDLPQLGRSKYIYWDLISFTPCIPAGRNIWAVSIVIHFCTTVLTVNFLFLWHKNHPLHGERKINKNLPLSAALICKDLQDKSKGFSSIKLKTYLWLWLEKQLNSLWAKCENWVMEEREGCSQFLNVLLLLKSV